MRAFRRVRGDVACDFESAEIDLLGGLLGQLIELLLDECPGAAGLAQATHDRDEEEQARQARRGLWALSFERPEAWRRQHPR